MRQERKVVTVLFCDLVGFTSQAEEMDPEDVAAMLGPYHARLKDELERYGGTVEKFIGDAVMALFGAPVAHEDDPERAVRAALAIREFAVEEGIELRVGVTTGEALVNLDARPNAGETMATGDVVNTAARLQSAAPVNGILVSEKTHEATRQTVEYREGEPVEAKGKAHPVPVWEAISATPLQERAHTTPLVGRERELDQLRRALAQVIEERAPKLVTVMGEPGVGKSRLVHELSGENGEIVWLRGRCLPYGDGVSYWALGEIVKTQLGVLESDSPERAEEKLVAAVEDPWVAGHLRTLVGIGEDRDGLGDDRAETFAAWRRFLTTLAEERPMALVLEDVQWADDGLLDFMSHLVEWALESPLLVLCTARPELLERRPGWGTAIPLAPLSDDDTGRLLTTLTEAEASSDLVARAAGNPLYAEQYARLIVEGRSPDDLPMTVHGIISARLDGLPGDEKSLLQDAAVVGEISWSGAVAAVGGSDRWTVEERLLALERRDLVRRRRTSAVEGQTEYAFAHVLVRDVAYAEMPRAERAHKHLRVAQWIESLSRAEDHAEVLAHHYLETLTLTKALGGDVSQFAGRARVALCEAGDRASALHSYATAARLYDAALDLPGVGPLDRPRLLLDAGHAHWMATEGGAELLQQASVEFRAHDDPERAAEAERYLAEIARTRGDGDRAAAHLDEALALVRARPPSPSIGRVLGYAARHYMVIGANEDAVRHGREALAIADAFELDDVRVEALDAIGAARMQMGDRGGQVDLERSIEIGLEHNSIETVRSFNNLGAGHVTLADLREVSRVWDRGREVAREFGGGGIGRLIGLNLINQSYWSGDWDTALQLSEGLIDEHETSAPQRLAVWAYDVRARVRSACGDLDGALEDSIHSLATARGTSEPSIVASSLAFGAVAALTSGRVAEASALADELLALHPARRPLARWAILFDLAVALQELGRPEAMLAETAQAEVRTRWVEAAEAQSEGEFGRAAEIYALAGALPLEAYVRMKAGEQLMVDERPSEAGEQLEQALAFWRSVDATRYIRQCEDLLAASA